MIKEVVVAASGYHGVVAGVDGSPQSLMAVELAAWEAARRRLPLRVLYGLAKPPPMLTLNPLEAISAYDDVRRVGDRIVDEAVARARTIAPGVDVTGDVIPASGAEALLTASAEATMVVVGDRGHGGFAGLRLGSVAAQLADHAACPILVARGIVEPHRPVLLATDCSEASGPAIGFAFDEAQSLGVPLVALHVWAHPMARRPDDIQPPAYDEAQVMQEEARLLAETLAGWCDQYPDVGVEQRVMHGRVRTTILDMTKKAQLVVVGARGHGGFTGLTLGSVSHAVVRHAACPVAIIPHTQRREHATTVASDPQPLRA